MVVIWSYAKKGMYAMSHGEITVNYIFQFEKF